MSNSYYTDDIDRLFYYNIHIPTKTIYIGSADYTSEDEETGTDHKMAENVIKGLHILDDKRPTGLPINIIMNNPGGSEDCGYAIYDSINNCYTQVNIEVRGTASSMGAIILQAGDWRKITKYSNIMVHYGSSSFEGHCLDFIKYAEQLEKECRKMEDLFLERLKEKDTKWTRNKFRKEFSFDKYLDAEEALDLGLVDEIV